MPGLLYFRLPPCLIMLISFAVYVPVRAQTIELSAGVQTNASLSGATGTLKGKSELRLNAASSALFDMRISFRATRDYLPVI